jgi:dTDP-D-glucose 4,6-dehydratase
MTSSEFFTTRKGLDVGISFAAESHVDRSLVTQFYFLRRTRVANLMYSNYAG